MKRGHGDEGTGLRALRAGWMRLGSDGLFSPQGGEEEA